MAGKKQSPSVKWKGTQIDTPEELVAAGNEKAIRHRLKSIEDDISLWKRFFNWPALFESFERDAEKLRAALRK